jgi:hypothetical protein
MTSAQSPLDPSDAAIDALAEASPLYDRYLELAELARLPDAPDADASGGWLHAGDWGECPLGLTTPSNLPLGLVYSAGE